MIRHRVFTIIRNFPTAHSAITQSIRLTDSRTPHNASTQETRMLVKNANEGLLTNHEVAEIIKDRKHQRLQSKAPASGVEFQHRVSVENKVTAYFQSSKGGKLSTAQLRGLLSKIKALNYELSESEMIQIANQLPEADVEFYLMTETGKLSEEQIAEIKGIISEALQQ